MSVAYAWFVFHPLHGDGYQFWSGIAGSFLTSLPGWAAAIAIYTRHHNCHEKGCPWLGHADQHGQIWCRRHVKHARAMPVEPVGHTTESNGGW